jgi:hypothetical protein
VQTPVQQARNYYIAREPRAVQEEQQCNCAIRRDAEVTRKGAAGRQQRCEDDRADEQDREVSGRKRRICFTRARDGSILFLQLRYRMQGITVITK